MVTVTNVSVQLNGQLIVDAITCQLLPGRITSFIGKSGAGKTTLLKTIAGLVIQSNGTIRINDQELSDLTPKERAQKIGFVFQDFNLFCNLNVLENCINPLIVQGVQKEVAQEQAIALLTEFGLKEHVNKYPNALSGGQQQRVAIVRALCLNPQVLLLDEPTASLDPENTGLLIAILQKLAKQGMTIGLSSQDMSFVKDIFDCVYFVEDGSISEYCNDKRAILQYPQTEQFLR